MQAERIVGTRAKKHGFLAKPASNVLPVTLPTRFSVRFWESADKRIWIVRTIKKRLARLCQDAGAQKSEQRNMLCQRAVFLATVLETYEVKAAEGLQIDLQNYAQMANVLLGILAKLGLERQGPGNGSGLQDYMNSKGRNAN